MNNVLLTGRLTRNAEIMDLSRNERKALKFTLAVERRNKNSNGSRDVDFIPIIYFTNHASNLAEYLVKGIQVSVSGKISIRSVEADDKTKKYYTNIIADNIDFLSSKKSNVL